MKKRIIFFYLFLFSTTIFAQRISANKPVIIKATSTECNVCGLRAWDDFKDVIDKYGDDAVIMAVHPLEISELYTKTSMEFVENMPVFFGTPSLYINEESSFENWFEGIRGYLGPFQERRVLAHPEIDYEIKGRELTVEVNTQFFYATNRPHYVSVYLIEDQVVKYQNSRGPEELHSKVMRTHLGDSTFGELLSETEIVENQKFTNNFTLELDSKWNEENIEIAVVIWEKSGEKYHIVNSNKATEPSFSTSVNFLEKAKVKLSVQPTILADNSTVQVDLPRAQSKLNVLIVNSLGQFVKAIYTGDLPKGTTSFDLNRNDLGAEGLYFLVVEKEGSRLVEKIIVE